MREGPGGACGICRFPGGSECDEWACFRGECLPGDSLATPVTPPAVTVERAADGCLRYLDEALGFHFHYPADATIEPGAAPLQAVNLVGPFVDDEQRPMFHVSHPRDVAAYRLPEGVDLPRWLLDHFLESFHFDS